MASIGVLWVGKESMELIDVVLMQLGIGQEESLDPKLLWTLSFLINYLRPDMFFQLLPSVVMAARLMPGSLGDNMYWLLGIGNERKSRRSSKIHSVVRNSARV